MRVFHTPFVFTLKLQKHLLMRFTQLVLVKKHVRLKCGAPAQPFKRTCATMLTPRKAGGGRGNAQGNACLAFQEAGAAEGVLPFLELPATGCPQRSRHGTLVNWHRVCLLSKAEAFRMSVTCVLLQCGSRSSQGVEQHVVLPARDAPV